LLVIDPDVPSAALAFRGLRDYKSEPRPIWRKLQIGNATQAEGSFGSEELWSIGFCRLLRAERDWHSGEKERGTGGEAAIHRELLELLSEETV
jgi:hypothetical protein